MTRLQRQTKLPIIHSEERVDAMPGKMKTAYGVYKKIGKEAFLQAAKRYIQDVDASSIDKALSSLESRWYDPQRNITIADKMVWDYNHGKLSLSDAQAQEEEQQTSAQVLRL